MSIFDKEIKINFAQAILFQKLINEVKNNHKLQNIYDLSYMDCAKIVNLIEDKMNKVQQEEYENR